MPVLTARTTTGATYTVNTTQPTPGLHIHQLPTWAHTETPTRWALATHQGYVLALFPTAEAATTAAHTIATTADWTQDATTVLTHLGPGGQRALQARLHAAGGRRPAPRTLAAA